MENENNGYNSFLSFINFRVSKWDPHSAYVSLLSVKGACFIIYICILSDEGHMQWRKMIYKKKKILI